MLVVKRYRIIAYIYQMMGSQIREMNIPNPLAQILAHLYCRLIITVGGYDTSDIIIIVVSKSDHVH